ncbi:MAG: hypothetical protein Tsb009_03500 [Planctomycetaceae bacterium]
MRGWFHWKNWFKGKRKYLTVFVLLIAVFSVWFFVFPLDAEPNITISKETTFLTEPVGKDGYIDYTAAVNARRSKGVTPENNAAVLLVKAIGPKAAAGLDQKAFYEKLGIAPLQEQGDYLMGQDEFSRKMSPDDYYAYLDELIKQIDDSYGKPWSRKQFPKLAAWLDQNKKPLDLVVQAVKRERYWYPVVSVSWGANTPIDLWHHTGPNFESIVAMRRGLARRAMLAVTENRIDEAMQDILASYRLSQHLSQANNVLDFLMGCAVEAESHFTLLALLESGKMSDEQLMSLWLKYQKLSEFQSFADLINFESRLKTLQCISFLARNPSRGYLALSFEIFLPPEGRATKANFFMKRGWKRVFLKVDWNLVLTQTNAHYDQIYAALKRPHHRDRINQLKKLKKEFPEYEGMGETEFIVRWLLLGNLSSSKATKMMGDYICYAFHENGTGVSEAQNRAITRNRLMRIAIALESYRRKHGRFPETLARLKPEFLKEIPLDLYSEKPFLYRPEKKGYLLNSVGQNLRDDKGVTSGPEEKDDIGIKMSLPE